MSREFGSYCNGYFYTQIDYAASDCLEGRDKLTQLWGEFFREFYPVAYAISSSEAGDHGVDFPISECIKHMPELKAKLYNIEQYLKPFQEVAEQAIKDYIKENK